MRVLTGLGLGRVDVEPVVLRREGFVSGEDDGGGGGEGCRKPSGSSVNGIMSEAAVPSECIDIRLIRGAGSVVLEKDFESPDAL